MRFNMGDDAEDDGLTADGDLSMGDAREEEGISQR
jgi:hypothetical protein